MNDEALRALRKCYDRLLDQLSASLRLSEARLREEQDIIQTARSTLRHARNTLQTTRIRHANHEPHPDRADPGPTH
jgi:hypothetical protein